MVEDGIWNCQGMCNSLISLKLRMQNVKPYVELNQLCPKYVELIGRYFESLWEMKLEDG